MNENTTKLEDVQDQHCYWVFQISRRKWVPAIAYRSQRTLNPTSLSAKFSGRNVEENLIISVIDDRSAGLDDIAAVGPEIICPELPTPEFTAAASLCFPWSSFIPADDTGAPVE